jgi:DNA-binding NarL/FixJ family response regulator
VLKESAGGEVVAAVRAVHAGRRYLSEKISPRVLEDYIRERGAEHPLERLSRRELQVLKLIVEGHTSNQVGELLGLSPKSVDTYRSRMMAKLEIGDLASLVKFAIRHGVTTVE